MSLKIIWLGSRNVVLESQSLEGAYKNVLFYERGVDEILDLIQIT